MCPLRSCPDSARVGTNHGNGSTNQGIHVSSGMKWMWIKINGSLFSEQNVLLMEQVRWKINRFQLTTNLKKDLSKYNTSVERF